MAVFFTTHATGFDFEDDTKLGAFLEKFGRDLHVFVKIDHRAVEHMGLEERSFALGNALARGLEERTEERVYFFGVAVIGVKCDEDVVFLREGVNGFREYDRSEGGIGHRGAGCELSAAGRHLNDPVGLGFCEGLEGSVGGG